MPSFAFLSPQEVEAIHQATLRILSEVGVALNHAGGRKILTEAGARVEKDRVLLPPELVEKCIAQCPPKVSVRGRGGSSKTLGDGSLYFHNLGGARDIFDYASGTKRYASLQDVRDATRLLDALPNCHTITPFFTPQDVPGELMSLAMYRHAMPFTTKPLHGPGVQYPGEVKYALEMAAVLGNPPEVLTLAVSPVSPLAIPDHEVEAIIEIARAGIAFGPLPCPTAGTTAPLSIAGAIAQQNAEVLAPLVLAQLVRPGLPIFYCGRLAMMEPRTGISVWGGIELGLASAGTIQMGHRYGLPVNVYGFSTNAHTLEIQDGFERAINAAIPALVGADELSGIGEMEAGVSGSFAQMVADNEFASSVLRLRRGITVNEEALAVEVIKTVMDGTHNFLGQKHTMKYLKSGEVFMTKLAERATWEQWEAGGRKNLAERAQAEAEKILREHQVEPLTDAQEKELDRVMAAAEQELVKK
jgi:trimethylamine---corrinoid protein Co-methyltransferase